MDSQPQPPPAPFLRPVGEGIAIPVVPEGWDTQRVGSISGDVMEVAFDPDRHDVCVVWNGKLSMSTGHAVSLDGWAPLACTDDAQIWSRDRALAASRNLDRLATVAAGGHAVGVGL